MFQAFSRSWNLVKASYNVLRADPELLVLPLISMIGVIILSIIFFVPMYFSGFGDAFIYESQRSTGQTVVGVVLLFIFYVIMYTIIIFSNVALVGAAMMRLRGEDPTVGDGLRIASQHLRQIVGYAAISATVGVILSALRDRGGIVGNIAAGLVGLAWNVVTFLVVPVLVIENIGPIDAVKRSGVLLKKTWGEQLIANGGVGLVVGLIIFGIVMVIGVPLIVLAASSQSAALVIGAIAITFLLVSVVGLFGSALSAVFTAALYNYATTGDPGREFEPSLITGAFRTKER